MSKKASAGLPVSIAGLRVETMAIRMYVADFIDLERTAETLAQRQELSAKVEEAHSRLLTLFRHDLQRDSAGAVDRDWLESLVGATKRASELCGVLSSERLEHLPLDDDRSELRRLLERFKASEQRGKAAIYAADNPWPHNGEQNAKPRLTETEQQVDDFIRAAREATLKQIKTGTGVSEATLTRHIIPGLKKKRGLLSKPYRYQA